VNEECGDFHFQAMGLTKVDVGGCLDVQRSELIVKRTFPYFALHHLAFHHKSPPSVDEGAKI